MNRIKKEYSKIPINFNYFQIHPVHPVILKKNKIGLSVKIVKPKTLSVKIMKSSQFV